MPNDNNTMHVNPSKKGRKFLNLNKLQEETQRNVREKKEASKSESSRQELVTIDDPNLK